jgi:hypothetical protein
MKNVEGESQPTTKLERRKTWRRMKDIKTHHKKWLPHGKLMNKQPNPLAKYFGVDSSI